MVLIVQNLFQEPNMKKNGSDLEKKTSDVDKKLPDISGLVKNRFQC